MHLESILIDVLRADWTDLVTLWRAFNCHLARVMGSIPADVRTRPRHPHNLHELTSMNVTPFEPVTLDDFMRDYVGHLEHHVRQIEALGTRVAEAG